MAKLTEPDIFTTTACSYTLARDRCQYGAHPNFEVIANFDRVKPMTPRSFVKEVFVHQHDTNLVSNQTKMPSLLLSYELDQTPDKFVKLEQKNI